MDKHVGQSIRNRRIFLGMSQEKLAADIGVTFQQLQKYERGANRVSASRLHCLSHMLSVPLDFFFDAMAESAPQTDDRETLEWIRAFRAIENSDLRRSALDMIRSLGKKQVAGTR